MAKMNVAQRAERVLQLLLGLEIAPISSAMARFGMGQDDVDEGWRLLRATAKARGARFPPAPTPSTALPRADAWENRWFPVIDASLARRFPDVHERVFRNLSRTGGPRVFITVGLMLERLETLAADAESERAWALLTSRGVTADVLEEARTALADARRLPDSPPVPAAETQAALAHAEADLWAWYLEWSQIARVAVKDRRLLVELGFALEPPGRKKSRPAEAPDLAEPPADG